MGVWGEEEVARGGFRVTRDRKAPWWVWLIGLIFLAALFGG